MAFNNDSDVLGADEQEAFFIAQFRTQKEKIPKEWAEPHSDIPETLAPSEVMYIMSESGASELEVNIALTYSDSTGERGLIRIHSARFDPSMYDNLGSAIKKGTYQFEN